MSEEERKARNREQIREYHKAHYEANREQIREYRKAHYEANRERILEREKARYEANRERILEHKKSYREANKERILEYSKAYYEANRDCYIAKSAKRRALKKKLIPKPFRECLIEKDRLVKIYKLRAIISEATGVEHHVDHMWPLSDGGPHWSGNLQIITAEENLSKNASVCEETKKVIQESLEYALQEYKKEKRCT